MNRYSYLNGSPKPEPKIKSGQRYKMKDHPLMIIELLDRLDNPERISHIMGWTPNKIVWSCNVWENGIKTKMGHEFQEELETKYEQI